MRATAIALATLVASVPLGSARAQDEVTKSHALSLYGDIKYPSDFTHFDYVNPAAPKGGTVRDFTVGTSFDTFNPFVLKGVPAAGAGLLFDTLTVRAEGSTRIPFIRERSITRPSSQIPRPPPL